MPWRQRCDLPLNQHKVEWGTCAIRRAQPRRLHSHFGNFPSTFVTATRHIFHTAQFRNS